MYSLYFTLLFAIKILGELVKANSIDSDNVKANNGIYDAIKIKIICIISPFVFEMKYSASSTSKQV